MRAYCLLYALIVIIFIAVVVTKSVAWLRFAFGSCS